MRSISSSLTKALVLAVSLVWGSPAAAQYFDIYGDANRTLPAAQSAFDAMPDDAGMQMRAELVSDLIMGLIGKAKYKEVYELYLENQSLALHPDARMAAIGHGLVAFTKDEALVAQYIQTLEQFVETESCAPCYARTFAAHHLARYFFNVEDDLAKSIQWHKRALDLSREDLAPSDPARVNFAYQYAAYLRNQDLEAAEIATRETEALALELLPRDDHLGWLYVFLNNALVALDKGRIGEAADLFSRIADIGVKEWGPNDPQLLGIYQNTAILLSRVGRTRQAVEVALTAQANQAYSDERELGYHQTLIARLLFEDARGEEAISYYRRALDTYDASSDDETTVARTRLDLANALSVAGEHEEALALSQRSLETFGKLDPINPDRRVRQSTAALVHARAGRIERAAEIMGEVLGANEDMLLDIYAREQDRAAIASDGKTIFRDSTLIALLGADADRAWRSAQLAVMSDLQASAGALAYPGDPEGFAAAIEDLRASRAAEIAARESLAAGEGSANALADASDTRKAAELALDTRFPDYANFLRPRPLSIGQAQAFLSEDEAYLVPLVYSDRIVTIALTSDGFTWGSSTSDLHSTRRLVERLRASLDAGLGGELTFDAEAAHELYKRIFTDDITAALEGKSKLIFPAGGSLAAIPPAVLISRPPEANAAPEFLIHDYAIAITPGLGLRKKDEGAPTMTFAGIGAPKLADAPADRAGLRGAVVDVNSILDLPSLPGAMSELAALGAAFSDSQPLIMTGDAATEAAVRAASLENYQVLAFATHGLVSGQISGLSEPALVMTPQLGVTSAQNDGLLTASEIAQLRLTAQWVILSACNTAAGEGQHAPIYSGLARAFQLAGARSLLLSHWPVRDDAASRLSIATLVASRAGMPRSEALRQAQLSLLNDPSVPGGNSPSVWAPFVLIE
ncbi:CHAT domain-containing protein [Erythrobacter sp. KY5]|uniref:CHAT domain-containing protein n=1 Tax=Erythrobacter sp. KY5 TaxID=2011159 RepID=UPI0013A693D4|nr:CHAT domain-containing tetratricopeptide repeat protein [Erythrobacter sp. KY5]